MRSLAVAVLLAAPALAAAADVVALLPATGANVGPGELAAATDVLRANLERTGRYVERDALGQAHRGQGPVASVAVVK